MNKNRPIRNDDNNSTPNQSSTMPHLGDDLVFGIFPRHRLPLIILFFSVTIGSFVIWGIFQRPPMLEEYVYEVVAEYPHDTDSYTQGLIYRNGFVYESTGKYGNSKLRKIKLETGEIVKEITLDDKFFGEGLCQVGDKLVQITWKEYTGFVYDMDLNKVDEFKFDNHGWGLTYDGKSLIMSDGTSTLYYLNPKTYEVENKIYVRKGQTRMSDINELEWINHEVYCNVLGDDMIYVIQPTDGKVVARINFQNLLPSKQRPKRDSPMNGIAIRADNGNVLVTGKNWPKIFEVKLKKLTAQ